MTGPNKQRGFALWTTEDVTSLRSGMVDQSGNLGKMTASTTHTFHVRGRHTLPAEEQTFCRLLRARAGGRAPGRPEPN